MATTISFPDSVWDGSNRTTQKNPNIRRAPDRWDYDRIAGELIATQTKVLNEAASTADHETRIGTLESASTDHETRIGTLETASGDHETRIGTLETTSDDHETRLTALEAEVGTVGTVDISSSTALNVSTTEVFYLVDASGGPVEITLPDPSLQRFPVNVKKVDVSGNAVTVVPFGAEVIDGDSSSIILGQWNNARVITNGTDWFLV